MQYCTTGWLVGLDYELPSDPSVANGEDTLPIVGCNHIVCDDCGALVKHADGRSVTSHFAPGNISLLYDSAHPEASSMLQTTATDARSRTYFCRCYWRTVHFGGKLPLVVVDRGWFCMGHE